MWPGDCPRSDRVDRIDAGLSALYLGFDLGGTNIRTAVARVLGDGATLLGRDNRATPQTGPESVVAALVTSAGAAKGARSFVYLTVSTGVGGAIVSDGRMVRGATNTAGELGHFPVGFDRDVRCRCGSYGCVEGYAAGRNLAEAYGVDDASVVYARAAAGDPRAMALIARAEAALASLAVGIVNALNPERIVVGGSVAEHEPSHVLEPMKRAIAERAFKVPAAACSVVPSALGADVSIIGSALAARDRATGKGAWFL